MANITLEDITPDIQDDRSEEEQLTHTALVGGVDSFLSDWGPCRGRRSVAFWACKPEDVSKVESFVFARDDISKRPFKQRLDDHIHIYVVREAHVALKEEN